MPSSSSATREAAGAAFDRNVAAICRHDPLVARRILDGLPLGPSASLEALPDGEFGLRHGATWIEGPRTPAAVARDAVRSSGASAAELVVVFGLGAGNVVVEALAAARPGALVVLVLIDTGAVRSTLSGRDLHRVLGDPRLRIVAGDLETIARTLPRTEERLAVVAHAPLLQIAAAELGPVTAMAAELSARHASHLAQEAEMLDNIEANLDAALDSPGAERLHEVFAERPILLVAPGPSLADDVELLRRTDRPALVALDTAVQCLIAADVVPDLVVTLDPGRGNLRKLEGVSSDLSLLFFEGARPEIVARHTARLFACERDGLLDRAHPRFSGGGRFESGGSVLHAALDVLLGVGAAPVALVGADLAPDGGRLHAGSSPATHGATGGLPLTREVPSRGGGTIATTESLWRHRRRIVRRLRDVERGRVIDATRRGAVLDGIPCRALPAFLDAHGHARVPLRASLSAQQCGDAVAERAAAHAAARAALLRARADRPLGIDQERNSETEVT